jgi:hypothetical protein
MVSVVSLLLVSTSLRADSLQQLETLIDKTPPPPRLGGGWMDGLLSRVVFQTTAAGLVYGAANSAIRTFDSGDSSVGDEYLTLRETGEPLIPLIRLEGDKFFPDNDILALSLNAEVGIAFMGLSYHQVYFEETLPDGATTDLTVTRVMGLYRMSFGNALEVDLGGGTIIMDGTEVDDIGFVFSAPIRLHPWRHLGVEFRPAWGKVKATLLEDYETSVFMTYGMTSLKAGYRWIGAEDESIDGPSIGLAIRL